MEEKENDNKKTRIGNKVYDLDTLNSIIIVRLMKIGVRPMEIKKILDVPKSLLYKWANYDKRKEKKWEDIQNSMNQKKFLFIKHPKVN